MHEWYFQGSFLVVEHGIEVHDMPLEVELDSHFSIVLQTFELG
jgi:hypothetical protein